MSPATTFPKKIVLIRHGATAWSETGQHTGTTDLPLESEGVEQAKLLARRLQKEKFSQVFSSPLKRALQTCELCNYTPILDPNLVEWNYGDFEGKKSDRGGIYGAMELQMEKLSLMSKKELRSSSKKLRRSMDRLPFFLVLTF